MDEELIDITDEDGRLLGETVTKYEIHNKGLYHHTAHLWLYTPEGQILLQQRAAGKSICPLMWDVSVAGHVDAGESIEDAAARECMEELGLVVNTLHFDRIGVFPCFQSYPNGIIDNEFHNTYICEFDGDLSKINIDTKEVEDVKLVSIETFKALLNDSDNNYFVPSNKQYYLIVLDAINQKLI